MTLDIGIGLLLGVFLSAVTSIGYGWCLFLGIVASLLPDIDFILPMLITRKIPWRHREEIATSHYPLLFIPLVTLIGFAFNSWVALIFFLGSLFHFIHDSIGIGWGIKWLFPFKDNSYCFLYRVPLRAEEGLPKKKFYSWDQDELKRVITKYHDPNALRNIYLQPTSFSIIEHLFLVVGVVVAILHP